MADIALARAKLMEARQHAYTAKQGRKAARRLLDDAERFAEVGNTALAAQMRAAAKAYASQAALYDDQAKVATQAAEAALEE